MTRTLHEACCPKCMGRGYYFDGAGSIHCDHSTATGSIAGMPVDPDEERWLALDRELDAMRERFRRWGAHDVGCGIGPRTPCSCGFEAERAKVFGGGA